MVTNGNAVSRAISLRAATPEDNAFLLEVFASTRDDFKMLISDENQLAALISMQYNSQQPPADRQNVYFRRRSDNHARGHRSAAGVSEFGNRPALTRRVVEERG